MSKLFLLIVNNDRDLDGEYRRRLEKAILDKGCRFVHYDHENLCPEADFAIVLGGDGTLLRAADELCGQRVPILGINTGTVGYLTGAEATDIEKAVDSLLSGNYRTEKRMMLDVSINGKFSGTILNDAVFSRNGFSRIINLQVLINGTDIFTTQGDGVIVSTPTGSTGYSMSAGGTICVPEAEMILVTPVCSHNLSSRAIIASAKDEITIVVPYAKYKPMVEIGATLDGQSFNLLKEGDRVTIKASKNHTMLIRTDNRTFFEALKNKLD